MNYDNVVAKLKTAKSVDEWNTLMTEHGKDLTTAERAKIESEGLIVKTLGADSRQEMPERM